MKATRGILVLGMALLISSAARAVTTQPAATTATTAAYTFACGSSFTLTLNSFDFTAARSLTSTSSSNFSSSMSVNFPVNSTALALWTAITKNQMYSTCKLTAVQTTVASSGVGTTSSTVVWTLRNVALSGFEVLGGPGTLGGNSTTVATVVRATVSFGAITMTVN